MRYEGVGTVKIKVQNENIKEIIIMMEDVLYVPELRENLLSTTTLMLKGYKITQESGSITVSDKTGNAILTGELIGRRLELMARPGVDEHCEHSYNVEKTSSTEHELWHKRLGHINDEYLSRMCNDRLADGLSVVISDDFVCGSCNLPEIKLNHRLN